METPVAFFIFRRPETTVRVFDAIRKARPQKLLIVADGGRTPEEHEICKKVRAVVERIDWPCEVLRNYADKNLGCKFRVSSGLDWVFQNAEEAIILEDDTLPAQSFFGFAEELLGHYKDNPQVMHIAGVNFQQKNPRFRMEASYYFSRVPQIWGWATWRMAWAKYDVSMESWPEVKKNRMLYELFSDPAIADYWEYRFSEVYEKRNSSDPKETWDSQWAYACLVSGGLAINPSANLVTNIGGEYQGTQMKSEKEKRLLNIPLASMNFPLRHPEKIEVDEIADAYSHRLVWGINRTFKQKIISFLKFKIPIIYFFLKSLWSFLR